MVKRKKSILRNLKQPKTTILGTVVIAATLVTKFKYPDMVTWWPEAFVGISLGVVLWIAPDTIVELIRRFVGANPAPTNTPQNMSDDDMVEPDNKKNNSGN